MAYENLRSASIEDVLNGVQNLAAVGSKPQVQSVGALLAKCTIEVGTDLKAVAADLRGAGAEIKAFNDSTTKLTKVLIVLNVILAAATGVAAIAAFR